MIYIHPGSVTFFVVCAGNELPFLTGVSVYSVKLLPVCVILVCVKSLPALVPPPFLLLLHF